MDGTPKVDLLLAHVDARAFGVEGPKIGELEISRFVFPLLHKISLFFFFIPWRVIEESRRRLKAMDHPKNTWRLLWGHLVRALAPPSHNLGILFLPLRAIVFFQFVINIETVLFQFFFPSGCAPCMHHLFGGNPPLP